jgi:hypothetical protein
MMISSMSMAYLTMPNRLPLIGVVAEQAKSDARTSVHPILPGGRKDANDPNLMQECEEHPEV